MWRHVEMCELVGQLFDNIYVLINVLQTIYFLQRSWSNITKREGNTASEHTSYLSNIKT
jgi:hypothetical protein